MGKKPKANTKTRSPHKPTVKRLTPKPEVLRHLFLLSGNNCAISSCNAVILSNQGTMIGRICHIEAALPGGPRFNSLSSNEDRRRISNLILLCSNHHAQIDDKNNETAWPVSRLQKLKATHEAKFRAIGETIAQAFVAEYIDKTDALTPVKPSNLINFNRHDPALSVDEEYEEEVIGEIARYVEKLSKVPDGERSFMVSIILRAHKLGNDSASVAVDDVRSALNVSVGKIKQLGSALERYGVGDISAVGFGDNDVWCVCIYDISSYFRWSDIISFCEKTGTDIKAFLMDINFGLLGYDSKT